MYTYIYIFTVKNLIFCHCGKPTSRIIDTCVCLSFWSSERQTGMFRWSYLASSYSLKVLEAPLATPVEIAKRVFEDPHYSTGKSQSHFRSQTKLKQYMISYVGTVISYSTYNAGCFSWRRHELHSGQTETSGPQVTWVNHSKSHMIYAYIYIHI